MTLIDDNAINAPKRKGSKETTRLKVTRLGDIQVQWKNNVAYFQAPLEVVMERQMLSKKAIPSLKSLALNSEFSMELAFETTIDIGEDWKLEPKTKFVAVKWLSEVKTLGGLIDIKKIAERKIRDAMPQILLNMDDSIRAKVHVDRKVARIWQNVQKPIKITQKGELVWLKVKPIQFEMGTITTENGNLVIQGRLSAITETIVGAKPDYPIDSILPPLVKRRSLPNEAYFYLLSKIPYIDINQIMEQKLVGHVFEVPGHRIKVKRADIWGCGADLILHLTLGGDAKGDVYFQGTPHYEPDSQKLVIRNFEFQLETQEALPASLDWLLHSTFKSQIENALSIPMSEKIAKIPEVITQGFERGKAGEKMDFIIETWDFKPQQIWVLPSDIAALIIVKAQVRIEVEKL